MLERLCENLLLGLRAKQKTYSERLCSGGFKTLADQKYMAGKYKELEEVEVLIKDTYNSMIEMRHLKEHRNRDERDESVTHELY